MNDELKEEDSKSNYESDYIIFHSKHNNLFLKKNGQSKNKKIINMSRNKFERSSSNQDIIMNNNKEEEVKSPFTNLMLREKISSTKFTNFLRNGEKLKLRLNNDTNNSTKDFLIINKFETINHKKNNNNIKKKTNDIDNKNVFKESKKDIIKYLNKNYNKNKNKRNILKNIDITQKTKKVSQGQQTYMDMNSFNNIINDGINYKQFDFNFKQNNRNDSIRNIPIKNKLTKTYLQSSEDVNNKINSNINNKDINKNIDKNNNRNINKNINSNLNILENNSSSLLYLSNPPIKEINENKINTNNIFNYEKINYSKDIFDSKSMNELNYTPGNTSNVKMNKTQRLIKNHSNIVSLDEVIIDDKRNFMSLRELYRQMISNKVKNNKKNKSILKKKKIKDYLKKKNEKNINKKKFNSNLISLEQYTLEKIKKKREFSHKIKIYNYNGKNIINNKNSSYNMFILKTNGIKSAKREFNDNIFSNILRSLSSDNKINNEKYNMKINKHSHINIMTMIQLNNEIKNKDIKIEK